MLIYKRFRQRRMQSCGRNISFVGNMRQQNFERKSATTEMTAERSENSIVILAKGLGQRVIIRLITCFCYVLMISLYQEKVKFSKCVSNRSK